MFVMSLILHSWVFYSSNFLSWIFNSFIFILSSFLIYKLKTINTALLLLKFNLLGLDTRHFHYHLIQNILNFHFYFFL